MSVWLGRQRSRQIQAQYTLSQSISNIGWGTRTALFHILQTGDRSTTYHDTTHRAEQKWKKQIEDFHDFSSAGGSSTCRLV